MTRSPLNPDSPPDFISRQVTESDYYFLNLRPAEGVDFVVTCGGLEYCDVHYRIDRSHFPYFGIEYIVSGACKLVLDGKSYPLKAGSIFCYGPMAHHQICNTGDGPLIKFFVDFTGRDVGKVVGDPFLKSPAPYQMPNLRSMHGLFLQMQEVGKQGAKGCQRILKSMLELIALLTRFQAVDLDEADTGSYLTYARCLSDIEQNYSTIRSVEELAVRCHVSSGHLARVFKKFAEESPWQMITRLKMNRAGELLLRDRVMIKEAAGKVGFEDSYHFSRVFKQHYGMSPRQFRESVRNSGDLPRSE